MSKAVIQPFEEYQKCRIMFVQTVAELANRPKHIESLRNVNVMELLAPLLSDPVTSIKQSAALAIGRLAKHSRELAKKIVENEGKIISQLLEPYDIQNTFYKKAICFVISSVARHSTELARKVAEPKFGSIKFLVGCLYEYDPTVKEAAVWALGYIAQHSDDLAKQVIFENKAIEYLICCLQEPETNIKRITIQTISHIVKHTTELTEIMVSKSCLDFILFYLKDNDIILKHKICMCLANMTKNSVTVAKTIKDKLEDIYHCVTSSDLQIKKSAITLLNEAAMKDAEYAKAINDKVRSEIICNFMKENPGHVRLFALPLVATLVGVHIDIARSYIKQESDLLAIIHECLSEEAFKVNRHKTEKEKEIEAEIKSLACRVIENLTKHDKDLNMIPDKIDSISDQLAEINIHIILLDIYSHPSLYNPAQPNCNSFIDEYLRKSTKSALESIIMNIRQLDHLIALVQRFPNFLLDFKEIFIKNEKEKSKLNKQTGKSKKPDDSTIITQDTFKGFEEILSKILKKQQDLLSMDTSDKNSSIKKKFLKSGNLSVYFKIKRDFIPNFGDAIKEFDEAKILDKKFLDYYDDEYTAKVIDEFKTGMLK